MYLYVTQYFVFHLKANWLVIKCNQVFTLSKQTNKFNHEILISITMLIRGNTEITKFNGDFTDGPCGVVANRNKLRIQILSKNRKELGCVKTIVTIMLIDIINNRIEK